MSLFLGIDLGTSGARCLVVDEHGKRVAAGSRPWSYRWLGMGTCVLDPDGAWSTLAGAALDACAKTDAADIVAIGVTSQRTGVVFLDGEGRNLLMSPNADGRGVGPGMDLEREHGDLVYRIAGRLPVMLYLPARLAAFRLAEPEAASRVATVLSLADWAVYRLTDHAIGTDPTQAAEMLVYDLATGAWSDELCGRLNVSVSLLPPIRQPGAPTGSHADEQELRAPNGLPVVAGGSDTQAAALGVGVTQPGSVAVVAGSTMLCEQVIERPLTDERKRLWTSPHVLPGRFVVEAHCGESGVPLEWMATLMGESPEWFDRAAGASEPGAGGLFFLDPAPSAVGDFPLMRTGSLQFPAPLLALARSREDVARAVLEGIAFAAKAGLEWTQEVAGEAEDVALTGGLARSRTFARILASALNRPVRRAIEPLGSALGAAIVAAVGAGAYETVAAAAEAMADWGETVEPEPGWVGPTAGVYSGWNERVQRMDENTMRVGHMIGRA